MILDTLILLTLLAAGLLLWRFLPAYVSRKAANLATKEDVAAITAQVEEAREPYAQALESFRTKLEHERQSLTNRQQLYIDFAEALSGVFISGRPQTLEAIDRFHSKHAAIFLAAPDEVVRALNLHLDAQLAAERVGHQRMQHQLRSSFGDLLVALRKEAFFPETALSADQYRFITVRPPARTEGT